MPSRKRAGRLAVVLVAALGTHARADALNSSISSWVVWYGSEWNPGSVGSTSGDSSSSGAGATFPSAMLPVSAPMTVVTTSSASTDGGTAAASAPTNVVTTSTPTPAPAQTAQYDGFINLGSGPYPAESGITTGNAQPWYDSPEVARLFGGTPTAQQQSDFANTVLQRVEQTFSQSGVPVSLTINPNDSAAHTLSVVSNTSAILNPSAIGMSYVGNNGFSFMDNEAKAASSVDQLEWIVAHNLSHELMLTFGVGENYDKSGQYIDAPDANWSMITSPGATFSTAAADALNQALRSPGTSGSGSSQLAQVLDAETVPEPATLALWGLAALGLALLRARRMRREHPGAEPLPG